MASRDRWRDCRQREGGPTAGIRSCPQRRCVSDQTQKRPKNLKGFWSEYPCRYWAFGESETMFGLSYDEELFCVRLGLARSLHHSNVIEKFPYYNRRNSLECQAGWGAMIHCHPKIRSIFLLTRGFPDRLI